MFFLLEAGLLGTLNKWDQWLFFKINRGLANPVFDAILPPMREALHWAPLYAFVVVFVPLNFRKNGWWWILFMLVTFSLTDMIGAKLIKETFERARPCSDPEISSMVRLMVDHCSGGFSFTSNHAANHFGVATFFYLTFKRMFKYAWLIFVWAGLISFAQIYVGVHYPADILGGTLLGIAVGTFTGRLFNNRYGFITFDKQPTLSS